MRKLIGTVLLGLALASVPSLAEASVWKVENADRSTPNVVSYVEDIGGRGDSFLRVGTVPPTSHGIASECHERA